MRILRPLYHSILLCEQCSPISVRILRPLHHLILHCAQCSHQYANTAPTTSLNTALCAMFPSVCEYCAHCITQYCIVRNFPISIRILHLLYHLILHCAQYSHQYANTAPTASLSTALCAIFLSVCKYGAHCITKCCTCAMLPSVCEYCAHYITQYCTVRNVPISMQIRRPLYH